VDMCRHPLDLDGVDPHAFGQSGVLREQQGKNSDWLGMSASDDREWRHDECEQVEHGFPPWWRYRFTVVMSLGARLLSHAMPSRSASRRFGSRGFTCGCKY